MTRHRPFSHLAFPIALAIITSACAQRDGGGPGGDDDDARAAGPPAAESRVTESSSAPPSPLELAGPREGGVVARQDQRLVIADEDQARLRVIPLPLQRQDGEVVQTETTLPGRPAAVLAFTDRVLVTIRDPGLLLSLRIDEDGRAVEIGRAEVADDAWGLTVTPDAATALVTSAWTQTLTAVEVATMQTRWTRGLRREPRGVVVMPSGDTAYVTHLTGAALTRIDDLDGAAAPRCVPFPAAPVRIPDDELAEARSEAASLAYAATLSPDASRLFVPRHALGASGRLAWAGTPTVDVLLTASDQILAEPLDGPAPLSRIDIPLEQRDREVRGTGPIQTRPIFAQPRAVAYREVTDSLLVVSEGRDSLVELDALAIDPSAAVVHRYDLSPWEPRTVDLPALSDTDCGAPSGIALSANETRAFVFCRSTSTLAVVALQEPTADDDTTASHDLTFRPSPDPAVTLHDLADDPLDEVAARGRRLFYDGRDTTMSFGMACAGCHPDGRDDGHVWHEVPQVFGTVYRAFPERDLDTGRWRRGEPRQTPMLAGRVDAEGPYGWRGKDVDLEHRVLHGFNLHHAWGGSWVESISRERAAALAQFLPEGLVPPPEGPALDAEQRRGREVFNDPMTGCASCHVPNDGAYTDREVVALDLRSAPSPFLGREPARFRTPSLRFLAGTAPYLHDGSAPSLEALIDGNHDRMGRTTWLSDDDERALIAFLKSFGGGQPPDETLPATGGPRPTHRAPRPPFSEPPAPEAWADAPELALARAPEICRASRLDDWVQIRCAVYVSEIAQVGGSTEGVSLSHGEPYVRPATHWWSRPERVDDAILTFPVRVGDRRQFQLLDGRPVKWGGVIFELAHVVSELWLPGAEAPTIVID